MAKQKGPNKIQGTIGDINYYKSQDGYLVREKSDLNGDRIATDPAFARTRENNAEFGRAGKASKLLRNALRGVMLNTADGRVIGRLVKEMMRVVKADATSTRGQRNVLDGELELLQGFEFNRNSRFAATFYAPYTATIDRVAGQLKIDIPVFIPANMVAAPAGATHFRIITAGAEVDFESETFVVGVQDSADLAISNVMLPAAIALVDDVTANSTHPLFLAVGIVFTQQVNGIAYPLNNGAFNSLALVRVDGGA